MDPASHELRYVLDPGIGGRIHDYRGKMVPRLDSPKATIMALITDGILTRKLPWVLVLLGVFITIAIELMGVQALPVAVGVYLPISTSSAMFAGGLVRWQIEWRAQARQQSLAQVESGPGVLFASGLIAGGAICGIVLAGAGGGEARGCRDRRGGCRPGRPSASGRHHRTGDLRRLCGRPGAARRYRLLAPAHTLGRDPPRAHAGRGVRRYAQGRRGHGAARRSGRDDRGARLSVAAGTRDPAAAPGPASPGARMARPALRRGALGPRADRDRGGRGRRRRSRRAVRDALVAGAQRPGARSRGRRAVWLRRRAGAPRGGPGHGPRRPGPARPARRVSRRQRLYLAPGAAPGRRRGNARAVDARLTVARRFVEIRWL